MSDSVSWRNVALGELRSVDDERALLNAGYIFREHPRNSELLQVTVLPINTNKYRPFDVPDHAVPSRRPPLTKEGQPCNPDGDIDRFGKHCKIIGGIWWRWYHRPNQPFFAEESN